MKGKPQLQAKSNIFISISIIFKGIFLLPPEMEGSMYVSYGRLHDLLYSRKLKESDLIPLAGKNSNAVSDIGKDAMVSINTLTKICRFFLC